MKKEALLFLLILGIISGCVTPDTDNSKGAEEEVNKQPEIQEQPAETFEEETSEAQKPVQEKLDDLKEHEDPFFQLENRRSYEILSEKEKALLPECGKVLLTVPPVPIGDIINIEPIGEANPPEHTLASISSDTYIAVDGTTDLAAPGDLWIIFIQPRYGVTQDPEDHVIKYALCKDVYGVVDHVKGFSQEMQEIVDRFKCSSHSAKPGDNNCPILIVTPVKAGTPLGKVGGKQGNFNFGTWDLRVMHDYINPERHGHLSLHSTCPFDYYDWELKEQLMAKIKRQGESRCGAVLHDKRGTLQGDWFIGDASVFRFSDGDKLLFLGTDNDFSDQSIISVGGIIVEQPSKWFFAPRSSGKINRKFTDVTDDAVHCYESDGRHKDSEKGVNGRMLMRLQNNELWIEHQDKSCSDNDWLLVKPTKYIR